MATSMLTVDIAINSLLCFTVSKRHKLPEKALKSIVADYYSIDEVIAAKKRLISDIELFATDEASFPRYPDRSGDKRFDREVNDVFAILNLIDERSVASKLPTYVTDNCDRIPSIKLEDGDLRFVLAKMDKMAAMIEGLQATMNALFDKNSNLTRSLAQQGVNNKNNNHVAGAPSTSAVQPTNNVVAGSSRWTQPSTSVYQPQRKQGSIASGIQPSTANSVSKPADHLSRWADAVPSTGESCCDTDGFQIQESYKKRRRTRTRSQAADERTRVATNSSMYGDGPHLQSQLQSWRTAQSTTAMNKDISNSRISSNINNDHINKKNSFPNSRKPLIVGKSAIPASGGASNICNAKLVAARPLKSVFCVDNVSSAYGVNELCDFVVTLGVRVISCFEVAPRYSSWQKEQIMRQNLQGVVSEPSRRAFRLCINRSDIALLLRADAWPDDITVSKWFFVKDSAGDVARTGEPNDRADNGPRLGASKSDTDKDKVGDCRDWPNLASNVLNSDLQVFSDSNRFVALQTSDIEMDRENTVDMENTVLYVTQGDTPDQPLATGTPLKVV
jgi:hypothetical protein